MNAAAFVFAHPNGDPSSISSKQDEARATQICKWFMFMATSEEATALKAATTTGPEGNSGNKRIILKRLNDMILDLLRNAFDAHPAASMPLSLIKKQSFGMNSIADRLRQLKHAGPRNRLQETRPYFQNFRTGWLGKRGAAAVGASHQRTSRPATAPHFLPPFSSNQPPPRRAPCLASIA